MLNHPPTILTAKLDKAKLLVMQCWFVYTEGCKIAKAFATYTHSFPIVDGSLFPPSCQGCLLYDLQLSFVVQKNSTGAWICYVISRQTCTTDVVSCKIGTAFTQRTETCRCDPISLLCIHKWWGSWESSYGHMCVDASKFLDVNTFLVLASLQERVDVSVLLLDSKPKPSETCAHYH